PPGRAPPRAFGRSPRRPWRHHPDPRRASGRQLRRPHPRRWHRRIDRGVATGPGEEAVARVLIVSFRLGGTDGVSIEAAKWRWALAQLGHEVTTMAGDGPVDHLVPELAMGACGLADIAIPSC